MSKIFPRSDFFQAFVAVSYKIMTNSVQKSKKNWGGGGEVAVLVLEIKRSGINVFLEALVM